MRNLLALLLFVPSLCLAQLPDYVPANGLIGWYPLNDGQASDFSGEGHHGIAENVTLEPDRFGNLNGAFGFQGQNCCGQPDALVQQMVVDSSLFNLGDDYSIACWFKSSSIDKYQQCLFNSIPHTGVVVEFNNEHAPDVTSVGLGPGDAYWNTLYQHGSFSSYNEEQWHHVTFTKQNNHFRLFVDGALDWEATYAFADGFDLEAGIRFGSIGGGHQILNGALDDCGIWSRTLTEEEVQALFLGEPIDYGCTDPQACNYDEEASVDNGLCEYGCLYCGEGTYWDSTLAQCVSVTAPCAPSCGEGTVWDPVNEECIIAIPADLNYDGCVSVNDLLVLLAVHGTCPPYPEWPDEPTDTIWTCGDPLTYWDYDYATVLIGDQCWFAENLRSAHYADGTPIPLVEENEAWTQLLTGARCSYMNSEANLSTYGGLYNWYAVSHESSLCPTGWRVPDAVDMSELATQLGGYPLAGLEMKSDTCCGSGWEGTNLSGFNALPGGWRNDNGTFGWLEIYAEFWESSSTIDNFGNPDRYFLYKTYDALFNDGLPAKHGCSVRCIKN